MAKLENWTLTTHNGLRHLFGNATGRYGLKAGKPVRTSPVWQLGEDWAQTQNTFYELGTPAQDFAAWVEANDFGWAAEGYAPVREAAITEVNE